MARGHEWRGSPSNSLLYGCSTPRAPRRLGGLSPKIHCLVLPQSLPNIETITPSYSSCEFILETVHHAVEEGWTSFWDNLKDVIVIGELQDESEYVEMVGCLTTFASRRNAIDRGAWPPSPLCIVFELSVVWENIANRSMEMLSQEVAEIRIGRTVVEGALSEVGAQE